MFQDVDREERESDAPTLNLQSDNGTWVVSHRGGLCPGPGPGDFWHAHDRLDDAVGDILDFFFGDPARMRATWREYYG